MATTAECFTGRVLQREYVQEFDFEFIPNYTVVTKDGVEVSRYISSYTRNFVTAKVVEQTFRFMGLTRAQAFATGAVTVSDLDGNLYAVPFASSLADGSSGSRVMIVEEVSMQRTPMSPRMWEVSVTRRGMRYYVNGVMVIAGPSWINGYV